MKQNKVTIVNIHILVLFSILALFLAGCGTDTNQPEESAANYYQTAMQMLDSNRVLEAVQSLEKIIEKYPTDSLYPTALYTVAGMYQSQAVPVQNRDTAVNRALRYYTIYYTTFKDSARAEYALFALGYLHANETKKYDEGKKYYEEYLRLYPNGQMAEATKQELLIIGKSPDEVLKGAK